MSLLANFHAPSLTPSSLFQIGQKSGLLFIYLFICSVNIKPPGIALALASPGIGNFFTIKISNILKNKSVWKQNDCP